MKPFTRRDRRLYGWEARRPRRAMRALGVALLVAIALLLLFLAWPYFTLWRLDQAVREEDTAALAELVDLDAIRGEIKKKLNKDADSSIGDLSDPFILWMQDGIQTLGSDAPDRLMTLSWVRARLLDRSAGDADGGFLGQVAYAFFDAPDAFVARIGVAADTPVHVRLTLRGTNWRVTALYY